MSILIVGLGAATVLGFYAYATHDRLELIDRPDVSERVSSACLRLTSEVEHAGADTRLSEPERILSQNRAVTQFVADVRALGEGTLSDDHPSLAYLKD